MRIGVTARTPRGVGNTIDHLTALASAAADAELDTVWFPDEFGVDPLLAAGLVGQRVPGIELGVGVVSMHPRHPLVVAAQALAVQAATGDRLVLGVGASHRIGVEGVYGLSAARPVERMAEYLAVVGTVLHERAVHHVGAHLHAVTPGPVPVEGGAPCPLLLAALGPRMVELAGRAADGVMTGFAGPKTLAGEIVPAVRASAARAGRPQPQVVASLPTLVTDDAAVGRDLAATEFALAAQMPAYVRVFAQEGAADAGGVAVVGDLDAVAARLDLLRDAGATAFSAMLYGSPDQQHRTITALGALRRDHRPREERR